MKSKLNVTKKKQTLGTRVGSKKLIDDEDMFYYLSSCPFFQSFKQDEVGGIVATLLPVFRYFHFRRMTNAPVKFAGWIDILNRYFSSYTGDKEALADLYAKSKRYFTNFYSLFHSAKRYDVIAPYWPYTYKRLLMGCSEVILNTAAGIRIYQYNFGDQGVNAEDLNYYGFRLQLAARIYHIQTGEAPAAMAVAYPATKWVVYFNYKEDEKLEELIGQSNTMVRRYGSHCAYCNQKGCSPLIDKTDKYGWSPTEIGELAYGY